MAGIGGVNGIQRQRADGGGFGPVIGVRGAQGRNVLGGDVLWRRKQMRGVYQPRAEVQAFPAGTLMPSRKPLFAKDGQNRMWCVTLG